MTVFLNNFSDIEDVKKQFNIGDSELEGYEILLASYYVDICDGSAYLLLRKDGKYYEVSGEESSTFDLEYSGFDAVEITLNDLMSNIKQCKEFYGVNGCQTKFAFADAVNELEELVNKLIGE